MSAALNQKQYKSPEAAREYLERLRWPNGPVCPHCGSVSKDHYELQGEAHRPGLWKCKDCREQFTVTVGTVFERSKIALNVWLQAAYLLCSSKKGMSSHQLHRILGVTYKTAWFMAHRMREAMKDTSGGLLGGGGKIVEADETYWGKKEGVEQPTDKNTRYSYRGGRVMKDLRPIVALVERGGRVRSYALGNVTSGNLALALQQVARNSHLMTDESRLYQRVGKEFAQHSTVNHGRKEYARGNVTTNTVEGYFAILKRGLIGTYHHVDSRHLQRYLTEFNFRYNNRQSLGVSDQERSDLALKQIAGKRLTYRPINAQA
jgi:transposase-like protein